MVVDTGNDFAFFRVGIRGDGEVWSFDGSGDGFRGRRVGEWDGRRVDEGDGGGGELWLDWIRGDGGLDVIEGGVGFGGRGHVVVVWKY